MRAMWLLPLFLLCGCGSNDEGKTILRVANWGGAKEGNAYDKELERIYREFEAQNPGVEVREESAPGEYVAKMSLAFIARSQPDVLMLDASSAALFIDGGIVDDLTPRMKADPSFRLDDFFPNAVAVARRKDPQGGERIYAVPQDFTPMVLYYNRRLFDRAGVPYPDGTWNFARFRDAAKRLTDPKAGQYGFAFSNWPAGWVMWLWNGGADHVAPDGRSVSGHLDSPASVRAVTFLRDLVKEGSAPSISQSTAMGADPFVEGKAAMSVSGHWAMVGYANAPKIKLADLGVAPLPHETPDSRTVMYESGYAIARHSRHKDAAWRFIRHMTSRAVQARYQASGIAVCARKDVAEARAKASSLEAAFLPIVPTARPPYGSRIEEYAAVEEEMQKAMDGILSRDRDPQDALTKAAKAVDREFAKG